MQPEGRDPAYLWDMMEYSKQVLDLCEGVTLPAYLQDRARQLAIERCLEIIGEAAKRISQEFRDAHPELPWRHIIAQRNVMAHEYDDILQELVWKTATEDVPALATMIAPWVPEPPQRDEQA